MIRIKIFAAYDLSYRLKVAFGLGWKTSPCFVLQALVRLYLFKTWLSFCCFWPSIESIPVHENIHGGRVWKDVYVCVDVIIFVMTCRNYSNRVLFYLGHLYWILSVIRRYLKDSTDRSVYKINKKITLLFLRQGGRFTVLVLNKCHQSCVTEDI